MIKSLWTVYISIRPHHLFLWWFSRKLTLGWRLACGNCTGMLKFQGTFQYNSYGLSPEEREGSKIGCRVKLNGDLVITILSRACKELWNYDGFKQRHQIFIPFHFPPHRPVNGELPLQGRRHALVGRSYRESHPTENHQ